MQNDDIDTDGVKPGLNLNPSAEGHSDKDGNADDATHGSRARLIGEGLPTLPLIVTERDPPAYLM